jgi:hypothetical protein
MDLTAVTAVMRCCLSICADIFRIFFINTVLSGYHQKRLRRIVQMFIVYAFVIYIVIKTLKEAIPDLIGTLLYFAIIGASAFALISLISKLISWCLIPLTAIFP